MAALRHTLPAALSAMALLALTASGGGNPDAGLTKAEGVPMRKVAVADAAALPAVVDATRRIGTVMLAGAPANENAVVSPSSLAVALAMLTDGAAGTSLAELESVLGATGEDRRDAFAALRAALLEWDGDPAKATGKELPDRPIIHLANQVVVDDQLDASPDFLKALADGFGAGVQHADLGTDEGKKVLDAWVKHNTGGLIEQSAIQPDPLLRLVLQDAILLAARWQSPFKGEVSRDQAFTLPDGSSVDTRMMAGMKQLAYAEVDGWQAVRLPYVEALHADVLLPPQGTDPATATPELLAAVSKALDTAEQQDVVVTLPTLDLKGTLDLAETIRALGAPSVLAPDTADFSPIGGTEKLFVGQAVQQAVLKVDEEGTVAAAVTEIGMTAGSAPAPDPLVVTFDRPYLFTISHSQTSWPLFLAAVRDPRH